MEIAYIGPYQCVEPDALYDLEIMLSQYVPYDPYNHILACPVEETNDIVFAQTYT